MILLNLRVKNSGSRKPLEGYFMKERIVKIKSVQPIGSSTFVEFENKNKLDKEWSAGVKSSAFNGAQVGDRWLIEEDGLKIISARCIYPAFQQSAHLTSGGQA